MVTTDRSIDEVIVIPAATHQPPETIYQVWYLRDDGILDADIFSEALQYDADHGSTIAVFASGKSGEETIELEIEGRVEAVFTNVGVTSPTERPRPSPTSTPCPS